MEENSDATRTRPAGRMGPMGPTFLRLGLKCGKRNFLAEKIMVLAEPNAVGALLFCVVTEREQGNDNWDSGLARTYLFSIFSHVSTARLLLE
ncbi:MAG: hypothetical protein EBU51_09005 [Synechococcaceae bacterium WB6_3A_227]|nr:hypothetical protein [Synechococcaceae bacterium WB6_3A_227]